MSDPYLSLKPQKVHSSCSIKSLIKEMLPGIQAMGHPVPDSISDRGTKSRDGRGPGHLMSSPQRLEGQPNPSDLRSSTEKLALPSTPIPPQHALCLLSQHHLHSLMHHTSCPRTPGSFNPCTVPSPSHSSSSLVFFFYPEMPSLTSSKLAPKTQKMWWLPP